VSGAFLKWMAEPPDKVKHVRVHGGHKIPSRTWAMAWRVRDLLP
jgi:hypothetical protein